MTASIELWQLYTDDDAELERLLLMLRDQPTVEEAILRHVVHLATATSNPFFRFGVTTAAFDLLDKHLRPEFVPPLILALQHPDSQKRFGTMALLARCRDTRALESLIARLLDPDEIAEVRANAATALGLMGDGRAIEPLLDCLAEDEYRVRASAIFALGILGDSRAIEAVSRFLHAKDNHLRYLAATALGNIHDPRALAPLIVALGDKEPRVRIAAAEGLGKLKSERAVPALEGHLYDRGFYGLTGDQPRVGDYAAKALEAIGTPQALQAVKRWRRGWTLWR